MIPISEVPEKYPKLVFMFEKETGKNATYKRSGIITKQFKYWLNQKIKDKNFICPECNKKCNSRRSLATHRNWHNKEYRKNVINKLKMNWQDPNSKYNSPKCKKNKISKVLVSNPYDHIPEFIDEFLKEHTYFTRNGIIYEYKQKFNPPTDKDRDIKLGFGTIIRHQVKIGMLEKYSAKTYKINK